ncbi:MAG: class I SAM-dependent methyltransferase [Actinomycetota bacterium]
MLDHKVLYNSIEVSRDYGRRDYIEAPEQAILEKLKNWLPGARMLDMGVGGARTTKYFAPLAKQYTGADYAPSMVDICRAKYGGRYKFVECDVRDMGCFGDGSFDFVLFSYNGIDSFSHQNRMSALKEIARVLSPGGYFAFSSHNLDWSRLTDLFRLKGSNLKKEGGHLAKLGCYARQSCRALRLSLLNRSLFMEDLIQKLRKNERGSLYDNSLNGKASIYYITRREQAKQLHGAGFADITTFGPSGMETGDSEELNRGAWIYYLCRKG